MRIARANPTKKIKRIHKKCASELRTHIIGGQGGCVSCKFDRGAAPCDWYRRGGSCRSGIRGICRGDLKQFFGISSEENNVILDEIW